MSGAHDVRLSKTMAQRNPMSTRTYLCQSQQRVLRVLMALFGHEVKGMAPGQVAEASGVTPGAVTRDLWNLEHAGLVERLPDGDRVRISPRLGSKAVQTLAAFDQAQRQLTDLQARYTRPQ